MRISRLFADRWMQTVLGQGEMPLQPATSPTAGLRTGTIEPTTSEHPQDIGR
jgi:hypothetical protein